MALQQAGRRRAGNDSTLTLVQLPRLDKATKTGAWFTALDGAGVAVQIDPIERAQLPQWIAQRLAAQGPARGGGEEGQRTLQFFADRVEGNLLAAHQEIQKTGPAAPRPGDVKRQGELSWAGGGRRAQRGALRRVQASEAVLGGQVLRVQRMPDGLEAEGEAPVLVHWALAEDIRALKRVKGRHERRQALPMALRGEPRLGREGGLLMRILPRANDAQLARLLQAAHQVDGIVKGLQGGRLAAQPRQALQRLALQLCAAGHGGALSRRNFKKNWPQRPCNKRNSY